MTRTPRPFICSKKVRDLTARMKTTISTGLMSVPVAIMSTVTAMRGMVAVAKALDEVLGIHAGGAVGDLLGEVVALAELLAEDFDDVLGVGVVLGEDEGLGHLGAAGKDLGEELVAEGFDDGADLVRGDDVAVELVGIVGEVVVELLPALLCASRVPSSAR